MTMALYLEGARRRAGASARPAAGRAAPARRPTTTASNAPRQEGVCDLDGGELYQREDDRLDVVSERIKVYIQDTVPGGRVLPRARHLARN